MFRWASIGVLTVAILTVIIFFSINRSIEQQLQSQIATVLQQPANSQLTADVDGRSAAVRGMLASDEARNLATLELQAIDGLRDLTLDLTVPDVAAPFITQIERSETGIAVSGAVPWIDQRDVLIKQLEETGLPVSGELAIAQGAPQTFDQQLDYAVAAIGLLKSGQVALTDAATELSGEAASSDDFLALQNLSAGLSEAGGTAPTVTARAPAISPYAFTAQRQGDTVILSGAVPSVQDRQTLADQIAGLGLTFEDQLQFASGAPANFGEIAAFVVATISNFTAGEITMTDSQLQLQGQLADSSSYFELVGEEAADLPAGIDVEMPDLQPPAKTEFSFAMQISEEAIELTGDLPNIEIGDDLIEQASSGNRAVAQQFDYYSGAPEGYEQALGALLDFGLTLADGEVQLQNMRVTAKGTYAGESTVAEVADAFKAALPSGYRLESMAIGRQISDQPNLFAELLAENAAAEAEAARAARLSAAATAAAAVAESDRQSQRSRISHALAQAVTMVVDMERRRAAEEAAAAREAAERAAEAARVRQAELAAAEAAAEQARLAAARVVLEGAGEQMRQAAIATDKSTADAVAAAARAGATLVATHQAARAAAEAAEKAAAEAKLQAAAQAAAARARLAQINARLMAAAEVAQATAVQQRAKTDERVTLATAAAAALKAEQAARAAERIARQQQQAIQNIDAGEQPMQVDDSSVTSSETGQLAVVDQPTNLEATQATQAASSDDTATSSEILGSETADASMTAQTATALAAGTGAEPITAGDENTQQKSETVAELDVSVQIAASADGGSSQETTDIDLAEPASSDSGAEGAVTTETAPRAKPAQMATLADGMGESDTAGATDGTADGAAAVPTGKPSVSAPKSAATETTAAATDEAVPAAPSSAAEESAGQPQDRLSAGETTANAEAATMESGAEAGDMSVATELQPTAPAEDIDAASAAAAVAELDAEVAAMSREERQAEEQRLAAALDTARAAADAARQAQLCGRLIRIAQLENSIEFAPAKSYLADGTGPILDRYIELISRCPSATVIIEGHTDSSGSLALNQRLSQSRANAVKAYFAAKGINNGRLRAMGYGETRPIASNRTEAGRQQNRRIEFVIRSQ